MEALQALAHLTDRVPTTFQNQTGKEVPIGNITKMRAPQGRGSTAVRIVEVGPRDGLQNFKTHVATETKLELVERLRQTGLKTIELTSIVSPKAVPQLADCRQLLSTKSIQDLQKDEHLRLPVLTPNLKGLQIAMEHNVREVAVFASASEGFSKVNTNCNVAEGLERARQVCDRAIKANIAVRGYVSCIFSDPFDGKTSRQTVVDVVRSLLSMGCYEVSLGDTLGEGTVVDVQDLLLSMSDAGIAINRLAGHFHDTYGQAVANVWAAYQCGIRTFDSSVAGLGGCPYCPGAKGNVATEDLVYLFGRAGIETGVNLDQIVEVGDWISSALGVANESRAGRALVAKRVLSLTKSRKGEALKRSADMMLAPRPLSMRVGLLWQMLANFWRGRQWILAPVGL